MRIARVMITAGCVAGSLLVLAAWGRGLFRSDLVGYGSAGPGGTVRVVFVMHGKGGVGFGALVAADDPQVHGALWQEEPPAYAGDLGRLPARWGALGFRYVDLSGPAARGWGVVVPLWSVLLPLAAWPAWQLWGRRRREQLRRRRLGLCRHCGYDLRATPGQCPECGTAA